MDSVVGAPIEAMDFQGIDGGLHRRVGPAGAGERWRLFCRLRLLGQLALSGQRHQLELLFERGLVGSGENPLSKLQAFNLGKRFLACTTISTHTASSLWRCIT